MAEKVFFASWVVKVEVIENGEDVKIRILKLWP